MNSPSFDRNTEIQQKQNNPYTSKAHEFVFLELFRLDSYINYIVNVISLRLLNEKIFN